MVKILSFGSLNIDKTYSVNHIVKPGETISANKYEEFIGGKGLNQSVAIARAGTKVFHAGLVGRVDGNPLINCLRENKVDVSLIKKVDGPSGNAIIQIDEKAMNSIIVFGGANSMVDNSYCDYVLGHFSEGDFLLIQNEISNVEYLIEKAYEKNMIIFFNPSPVNYSIENMKLDRISYFIVNELEGMALTKQSKVDSILDKMLELYPKSKTILTLGSDGAIYSDSIHRIKTKAITIEPVDTTGAGDTFTGYFISGIASGLAIEDCMELSCRAAAKACTVKGASNSIPLKKDLI